MNKPSLIFIIGMVLLCACKKNRSNDTVSYTGNIADPTDATAIQYSDTLILHDKKIMIDTSSVVERRSDVLYHRVNTLTGEIMRVYGHTSKDWWWDAKEIVIGDRKIAWDKTYGFPNEFIGQYIFSDVWRGDGMSGDIIKHKFLLDKKLTYIDSIPGGYYSEGAGSREYLISDEGKPGGLVFEETWTKLGNRLLISSIPYTHFIDLYTRDTLVTFERPANTIYHQLILNDGFLFETASDSFEERSCLLRRYDSGGKLQWSIASAHHQKIIADTTNRLLIGVGTSFTGIENDIVESAIAYDLDNGKMLWNFPARKAYDDGSDVSPLHVPEIIQLNNETYVMIAGLSSTSVDSYKLIFFDRKGKVFRPFSISDKVHNLRESTSRDGKPSFTIVYRKANEFDIVTKNRTTKFRVSIPD